MDIALEVREEPLRVIDAFPFFNELGIAPTPLDRTLSILDP